jgi:hypothetical protein
MKIKLESKQAVEVLADTLDETLDALHVRPARPFVGALDEATSRRRRLWHLAENLTAPSRSPTQEHDASMDPRVANLLQRQSFAALKERILTCLVHNTTVPGGMRCVLTSTELSFLPSSTNERTNEPNERVS